MKSRETLINALATGGGIGNIRFAPGTFGSAIALPLCFALSRIPLSAAIPCTIAFILFAIWVAGKAEELMNAKDPGCIVIDEIAGMMVTFLGLPFDMVAGLAGFLLFRVFDILKPFPIKLLDQRLTGGFGVVMDDVAAGVCANAALRLVVFLMAGRLT